MSSQPKTASRSRSPRVTPAPGQGVIADVENTLSNLSGLVMHYDRPVDTGTAGSFQAISASRLHADVLGYIAEKYPGGLYRHQADAIQSVLDGNHTVVATRTSSGKSLIYALPTVHELCNDPNANALFLFPQKALANDQFLKFNQMGQEIPSLAKLIHSKPRLISRYDGSTSSDDRPEVRRDVQLLLTNPDMLHLGIMQHHAKHWGRFFSNLKIVAIDECHEYRGVFGTNVAYILHRLRQICRRYGSNPRFIATSATVRDPQTHMERLTGVPFQCVDADRDGSIQGQRKFWIVGSTDHYYDTGRKLAIALAEAGLSVLAFCPSRVSAERMIARLPKSETEERSYVRVYRSGLSGCEREEIEHGLRNGSVRLVFSTSALELGIDIGQIDVVVCIGVPHSMMSLWQRAGRAARGGRDGAIVFIPADTPIDTYYANHPQELFRRDHEPLALNLTNQRLVCQHYACAIHEVDGDESRLDLEVLGPEMTRLHELRTEGKINRDEFYRQDPHMEVNIRSANGDGSYALVAGEKKVGEIDSFHLLRESYPNAIYRHGGRSYRVKDVIRGKRLVRLAHEYTRNDTSPFLRKSMRLKQQFATADYSSLRVATVSMDVTEFLVCVTEKDPSGHTVRTWQGAAGMQPHHLPTTGTMLVFKAALWNELLSALQGNVVGALRSCERLFCSLFPTVTGPCDTQDFSSGVETLPTGEQAIFLYDLVYDGVDLTKDAFDKMDALVSRSQERLESCDCATDQGCIRCIANPFVEEVASKVATGKMLSAIDDILRNERPKLRHAEVDWSRQLMPENAPACPACQSPVPITARFCHNCGQKIEVAS